MIKRALCLLAALSLALIIGCSTGGNSNLPASNSEFDYPIAVAGVCLGPDGNPAYPVTITFYDITMGNIVIDQVINGPDGFYASYDNGSNWKYQDGHEIWIRAQYGTTIIDKYILPWYRANEPYRVNFQF